MFKLLTNDVWSQGFKLLTKHKRKTAAISYVTVYSPMFKKGDALICDASKGAIECGETNASVLRSYMNKGVQLFSVPNFHAKLIVTDNAVIIGSANLSRHSADKLVEASFFSDDLSAIAQAHAFCYPFMTNKYALSDSQLTKLEGITPKPYKRKERKIPEERKRHFGGDEWIINTVPNKTEKYAKEIEELEHKVAGKYETTPEHIDTLTWRPTGKFALAAQPGNSFIRIHTEGKRSWVYSQATLVHIEKKHDCTLLLFKMPNDYTCLSWSEFHKKTKDLDFVKKISKKSCRRVSSVNFQLLQIAIQR